MRVGCWSLSATLCLLCSVAFAVPPAALEQQNARGLALGTGARASAMSTSALLYNPASLSLGRLYHLESGVAYHPSAHTLEAAAMVVDSMTSRLAAGFSARALRATALGGYAGVDLRLGFGLPLSDGISVGGVGRYLSLDQQVSGGNGTRPIHLTKGLTFDMSLRLRPFKGLELATLGYNLLGLESALVPRSLGASAALAVSSAATVAVDLFSVGSESTYLIAGGGAEYVNGSVPMRLGYRYDAGHGVHAVSGGIGYLHRRGGFDLAIRREVAGGAQTLVMGSLRYFVH